MTRSTRRAVELVAAFVAAFVAVATSALLPTGPAEAAGCPTDHGVTVVVDFHGLGGGVQTGCVAGGGGDTASSLFPAAGFPLTYVQRQPGFVCRVSGKPADDPCASTPPADAYWALYWSDGKSGSWTYATSGAGGQRIPDGGYVAFSWNGGDGRSTPGYTPAAHPSASPSPTHAPTHASSQAPTHSSTSTAPSSSGPASASASGSPTESPAPTKSGTARSKNAQAKPKPSATTGTPTSSTTPAQSPSVAAASSDPADPGDGGLPGWVAPAVIVVLFGAAGAVAVVRRRRQGAA